MASGLYFNTMATGTEVVVQAVSDEPLRTKLLVNLAGSKCTGGDAKLLLMLCVSHTQQFLSETLRSLGFSYRAKQIQRDTPHRKNDGLKRK
ncbi:kinesin-like protein KIF25 isoform X1 [Silurus meridionalis]|nr:kinesin-like protein KIF25 isoform X1 [Silurus meridionalis]